MIPRWAENAQRWVVVGGFALVALLWVGWDFFVVPTFGLEAGLTVSWWIGTHVFRDARSSFAGALAGCLFGHFALGQRVDGPPGGGA